MEEWILSERLGIGYRTEPVQETSNEFLDCTERGEMHDQSRDNKPLTWK
jgi:hypothetical protein